MKLLIDRVSMLGCWLLGLLFTWSALFSLVDQYHGADPHAGAAFAQLMVLALLCAWVLRSYQPQRPAARLKR